MKKKLMTGAALLILCGFGPVSLAAAVPSGELLPGMTTADLPVLTKVKAEKQIDKGSGITILGPARIPQEQMVRYILKRNPTPKLHCTVEQLVGYYYEEGLAEGVRPDIALCQAIKETACFAYGKDVLFVQNNYCGLGATGNGEPGAYFATPQRGARAHIQHLLCYATTRLPQSKIIDPRYDVLRKKYTEYYGKIPYWTGLNGKWALPGTHYGQEILQIWTAAKKT
jgi:hypothetical protein